jgi:uncharacterized RDD family membrane protein YckC
MQTSTSTNPDSGSYYVVEHGQKKGPLPFSALETMRRGGTLTETTLLWVDGMAEWEPATKVIPQLFFHAVTDPVAHPGPQKVTLTLAHPKWRFLGGLIDVCVLYLPMQIVLVPAFLAGGIGFVGELVVPILYEALLMASPWQGTVGMKLLGLKVVDESGRKLLFGQSLGRAAAAILSLLPFPPFCVGYWMIFFTKRHQTLHDMMAKTLVVRNKDQ